jgi:glucose-1-phosphate thymidylyltransferase
VTITDIDKAVILARGRGTRMRRADESATLDDRQATVADTGVKALIPIDRPFLDYVLSTLADAGYRRICLVVGPEHQEIRDYYGSQVRPERIDIDFAIQKEAKGTADAVAAAESFAGDDPFLMLNSDDYYPREAYEALRRQDGAAVALFEKDALLAGSNISAERIGEFAIAQIDEEGFLTRIIEKPDESSLAAMPKPLWVNMNCWRFGPTIFQACRSIQPSVRGEYELPDAVQYTIDVLDETIHAVCIRLPVLDLTSRSDIAAITAELAGMEVNL